MVYLSSTAIALLLFFLEASLMPYFFPWLSMPILVLPFLSVVSLKDRTIYPVFLTGILGLITDSISGGTHFTYLVAYLGVVVISKLFLDKFLSYGEFRANLITMFFGIIIIYSLEVALGSVTLVGWTWLLAAIANIVAITLVLILYIIFGKRYFSWLEKETEERFR